MNKKQEVLNKLIDEVLKASSVNQDDVNRVAESPFLYSRLRVQIKEEERRQNEMIFFWNELFFSFKLATKVLALLAIIAIGFLVFGPSPEAYPGKEQASIEQIQPQTVDITAISNEDLFSETIGLQNDAKLRDAR